MNIKKILAIILSIGFIMPASTAVAADDITLNMKVDEADVVREIPPELYGVNMEWSTGVSTYGQKKDENGQVIMNETFPEKYGNLLQFARKAGSSANVFLWKDALGDFESREKQKIWSVTGKVYEGVVEWLELLYAATDSPRINYVVNIFSDTEENIADIVEFMVGDGTINHNGGENWAEYRIKMGFKEPVDVFAWEIGNELDWTAHTLTLDEYLKRSERAIDIIKDIDPDAKICMHASTAIWNASTGSEAWHRGVLKELGDRIDYLSIHYYYPAGFIRRADGPINAVKQDILEITGSDRIKIYYSEHAPAKTVNTFTKDDNYAYCLPHTIWGATSQAEFYLRKWLDPWVVAATCHSIDSANWGISYTDENGDCQFTAVGEMMKSFKDYGIGKMYNSNLDTFSEDQDSKVAGGVVEDEKGNVNILFVNRNNKDNVHVDFEFNENQYKLKHIRKIHGDVRTADNWYRKGESWKYDNPDRVEITEEDVDSDGYFTDFTFEPLSVYALQLEKVSIDNKDEIIAEHLNKSVAFGFESQNVLNKGTVAQYGNGNYTKPVLHNGSTYVTAEMLKALLGNNINIDMSSAINVDGKQVLPLRATVEKMGYSIVWDDREFIILYKNGELTLPNSSWVRNAVYKKLIGG